MARNRRNGQNRGEAEDRLSGQERPAGHQEEPLAEDKSSEVVEEAAPISFGRYLVTAREATGLSLNDLAQATKVRRAILEALETDARRELPEKVFVAGYVRSYAVAVGLHVEETLRRFHADYPDEDPSAGGELAVKSRLSYAWVPPLVATAFAGGVFWFIINHL